MRIVAYFLKSTRRDVIRKLGTFRHLFGQHCRNHGEKNVTSAVIVTGWGKRWPSFERVLRHHWHQLGRLCTTTTHR